MNGVFMVLFLLSIVLLIWGLIAPHHFAKHAKNKIFTRKDAVLGFGFFTLIFLVLVAITAPSAKPTTNLRSKPVSSLNKPSDTVTSKQITETQSIPFATTNQNDSSLPDGQTKIVQAGKDGTKTLTYQVTYTNGQQTEKKLVKTDITEKPVDQIVDVGTYVAPAQTPTPNPSPISSPSPAPSRSCHPLTNGGKCYEPGEFCRDSDHGISGVAGDGKSIVCSDNNGWRWEPE